MVIVFVPNSWVVVFPFQMAMFTLLVNEGYAQTTCTNWLVILQK